MLPRSILIDEKLRLESLLGVYSHDQRAESIIFNTNVILNHKRAIAEKQQTASAELIKKYNATITSSKNKIKSALAKLGASEEQVKDVFASIDQGNTENVQIIVFTLLAKRNPGMYARKLAEMKQK